VTVRRDVTADELEILLERGKRKFSDWELSQEIEKEARYKTWLAYRKRNVGRLFPVGPHEGREKRHWQAMEAMWYGKAIGCVAVLEEDMSTYSYEEAGGRVPGGQRRLSGTGLHRGALHGTGQLDV
jgi:hypothetical protein